MRAPGPWTSGAPIVAAEAEPASAAEPATALMATSEAVRRNVGERVMGEAPAIERGAVVLLSRIARAGPDSGPPGWRRFTPCQRPDERVCAMPDGPLPNGVARGATLVGWGRPGRSVTVGRAPPALSPTERKDTNVASPHHHRRRRRRA